MRRSGIQAVRLYDLARGTWSRLSFNPADEIRPAWSPDGNRILFAALSNGYFNLFVRHIQEGTDEELLERAPPSKFPVGFTVGGRSVVFKDGMSEGLWMLPLGGKPVKAPPEIADVSPGDNFSPDGRWLAFSVRRPPATIQEIYVTSFPTGERTWKVSSGGGIEPKWRKDGKELFYLAGDGRLMAWTSTPRRGFGPARRGRCSRHRCHFRSKILRRFVSSTT